jgi:hypothetical protein
VLAQKQALHFFSDKALAHSAAASQRRGVNNDV